MNLEVTRETPTEMSLNIFDEEGKLFSLPNEFPFPHTKLSYDHNKTLDTYGYEITAGNIRVYRKNEN